MSNKTHSEATGAYTSASNAEKSGRDLEADVLNKSALRMDLIAKRLEKGEKVKVQEMGDIFDANQKIWQIFLDSMVDDDCPLPQEIKDNIGSLAVFTFKHTLNILADPTPAKIQTLVDINRNIANGLSKKPPKQAEKQEHTSPTMPKSSQYTQSQQTQSTKKPSTDDGKESSGINIDI